MSVDKFRFTKDDSDYTTFTNELLQQLRNAEALGLYCYLSSLPPTWNFQKEQIRSHFNFGRDKLEKLFNFLIDHNLIDIYQERNLKGYFTHWRMHVNNPRSFQPFTENQGTDTDLPFTENQGTDEAPSILHPHRLLKNRATVNQLLDSGSYKRNINKINKKQKRERGSLCFFPHDFWPNEDAFNLFNDLKFTKQEAESCFNKFKEFYKNERAEDWQQKLRVWILREHDHNYRRSNNDQKL